MTTILKEIYEEMQKNRRTFFGALHTEEKSKKERKNSDNHLTDDVAVNLTKDARKILLFSISAKIYRFILKIEIKNSKNI